MSSVRSLLARVGLSFALATSAAALSACGTHASADAAAPAAEDGADALQVAEAHDAPLPPLFHVEGLTLRPEQKTRIDQIRTDLRASMQPMKDARKAYTDTLAAGVEAGLVDREKLDAAAARIAAAADASRAPMQKALVDLHATLDPEQRRQLVQTMKDRGPHGPGVAHDGDPAKAEGARGKHGSHGHPRAQMKKLAEDLKLTDEQKDAFKEQMKAEMRAAKHDGGEKHRGGREHMKAMAESFASDTFDPKTMDHAKPGDMTKGFTERATRFAETATKILNAEQRALLAKRIRERGGRVF